MLIYYFINCALLPSWEQKYPFFACGLKLCKTLNIVLISVLNLYVQDVALAIGFLDTSNQVSTPALLQQTREILTALKSQMMGEGSSHG